MDLTESQKASILVILEEVKEQKLAGKAADDIFKLVNYEFLLLGKIDEFVMNTSHVFKNEISDNIFWIWSDFNND